jgi:hypothetical protein
MLSSRIHITTIDTQSTLVAYHCTSETNYGAQRRDQLLHAWLVTTLKWVGPSYRNLLYCIRKNRIVGLHNNLLFVAAAPGSVIAAILLPQSCVALSLP